jgi:glycosyltransferase involved in cell wall biosynthesis
MRLLVDATAIPADLGGVGRYVDCLLPELSRLGVDVIVLAQPRDVDRFRGFDPAVEVIAAPRYVQRRALRLIFEQLKIPGIARRARADAILSPHYTMPLLAFRTPRIVTLHDATFFTTPELHGRGKGAFFRAWIRVSARRADALVTPSKATRDEVVRIVGADQSKFFVAYHGVDAGLFHPVDGDEIERVRETLGVETPSYIGFLGTLEPRKNVPALIRGWVAACEGRDDPPALILAGGKGWDTGVDDAIAAVPPGLTVRKAGYLPLEDLAGFLSGATVLAYPSLGEGFGLPVLEAMACGATVLTTRLLSLPEVGGEAVAYCGTDEASIAQTLAALLDDDALRATLATAALERASEFTWEAAASVHLAAIEFARK